LIRNPARVNPKPITIAMNTERKDMIPPGSEENTVGKRRVESIGTGRDVEWMNSNCDFWSGVGFGAKHL
jgi:hypothetical protein